MRSRHDTLESNIDFLATHLIPQFICITVIKLVNHSLSQHQYLTRFIHP